MNRKMKLRYRAVLSLMLSAVLFCMPAVAFSMNGDNAIDARAEDSVGSGTEEETGGGAEESPADQETSETEGNGTPGQETESNTGSETENGTEGETGGGTVSGNDVPGPVCACEKKCGAYDFDKDCQVCAADYKDCEYKTPNVVIHINSPGGWYNEKAAVTFSVSDTAHTGNFETAKIQAKVGQNGSWTDVTEDKKLEISENCTIYVQVTDQKGNTYERSRTVRCFDTTKPTLNAAVSDGLLSVQVHDTDSGAKAVYVNGYEFTELTNGTLNIRLQQFDAGYEYFTISAMDNAGNMSEVYKTKNPYYKDPADESDENPAKQLPASAEATKPGNATATVTEHTRTDSDGNTISQTPEEQKKEEFAKADAAEKAESGGAEKEQSEQGKEFYTIQTASDKVFYLIIDRDGEEEMVYFLTEITENDLLNATSDNSETLPKNSSALESAIPTEEGALPNNNGEMPEDTQQVEETEDVEDTEDVEGTEETEPEEKAAEPNPVISYILMGALAIAFIGGAYYFKVVRKKKEDFIEDEDEDEEDEEELENEDEEPEEGSGDDFFDDKEDE
ncbi:DUF4366 domain-containing protein [Candidatus Ventrimonas sp. KK005]